MERVFALARVGLAQRKAVMDDCPVRKNIVRGGDLCPKCKASIAGPCWLQVEADAIAVDYLKEIASLSTPNTGDSHDK